MMLVEIVVKVATRAAQMWPGLLTDTEMGDPTRFCLGMAMWAIAVV